MAVRQIPCGVYRAIGQIHDVQIVSDTRRVVAVFVGVTLSLNGDEVAPSVEARRVKAADLVTLTLRYGDKGTLRRIGALLERAGIDEALLRKLDRALPTTSSPIPWIPRRAKRGPVGRRWGVVWNTEA